MKKRNKHFVKNVKNYCCVFLSIFLASSTIFVCAKLTASAAGDSISLGKFDFTERKFVDASGTGSDLYKSVMIAYGNSPVEGERLVLPTVSGFEKSDVASTNTSTIINMSAGKTPSQIADYIRQVTFENSPEGRNIQIVLSENEIYAETFYLDENDHYYQYIRYTDIGTSAEDDIYHSWIDAYNQAKTMTFSGRRGYLATVTNLNEDIILYEASEEVGWLGGTILSPASQDGTLYYNYPSNEADLSVESAWYWANGPERGNIFFEGVGTESGTYEYNEAQRPGVYFNWKNWGEPNHSDLEHENCLTTLRLDGGGYAAVKAGSDTIASWNDFPYYAESYGEPYAVKGYFVEYGDQVIGDSGQNTGNSVIANTTIYRPIVTIDESESLVYDGTEKKADRDDY